MSGTKGKEPEDERATWDELQKDSLFMHWKAHHERALKACEDEDVDLMEKLCEKSTMQAWGVPRLFQAEAHAMLAMIEDRDDCVAQALAAREQYRRMFLKYPDDSAKEELYSNAHVYLREVQARCGMTELAPLYQGQGPVKQDSPGSSKIIPDIAALSLESVEHVSAHMPSTSTSKIAKSPETIEESSKASGEQTSVAPLSSAFSQLVLEHRSRVTDDLGHDIAAREDGKQKR